MGLFKASTDWFPYQLHSCDEFFARSPQNLGLRPDFGENVQKTHRTSVIGKETSPIDQFLRTKEGPHKADTRNCSLRSVKTKVCAFRISAQLKIRWPLESRMDWLKFKPFKLKAIVLTPSAVNQIPITGQAAKKKCKLRELLKEAYYIQD